MKIPPKIEEALNATDLPWAIEPGGKHAKIKLGGRLVGILTRNKAVDITPRCQNNTIAQIKRMAVKLKGEKP